MPDCMLEGITGIDKYGRMYRISCVETPQGKECGRTLISALGSQPFRYRVPCMIAAKKTTLIDADIEQAARGIRGVAAAIDSTIFADAEPFDPEQFVTDVIAS